MGIWLRVSCHECGEEKLWGGVSRIVLYNAEAESQKLEGNTFR